MTIESRKGNDRKIRDDFKAAVQDAYDQGFKCAEALSKNKCKLIDRYGNEINPLYRIKQIYLLCVVSDHYQLLVFKPNNFYQFNNQTSFRRQWFSIFLRSMS